MAFAKKKLIYTFTILSTYERVCGHQMQRRYITKDVPYKETSEMAWGNKVHSAFEHRIGSRMPLPDGMQQWEKFAVPFDGMPVITEQKLGITREGRACDYWDENCFFRGKADLAVMQDENGYINDWKTGNSKYEDPFELETNAVLLVAKYPQLRKLWGTYTWLKEDRLGQKYNLSNVGDTWARMCDIIGRIENDIMNGDFKKRRTPLCSWCNVADCENNTNPEK